MGMLPRFTLVGVAIALVAGLGAHSQSPAPLVRVVRLPAGSIQPQAAVDARGDAHVVYFSGEAANGDLFYSRLTEGMLSSPVRVNSRPGSAIATGTVRGARIAAGRNGRVHVAWNGSGRSVPAGTPAPMLYARLADDGKVFEPERNLIQFATGLDGGGAIAADARGRVMVAWHAGGPESRDEGDRRVWLAASTDDGRTFARERAISSPDTGACGCCGMAGLIDADGNAFFLYRSAREIVNRDSYLLASRDSGRVFESLRLHPWNIGACPMSMYDLAPAGDGAVLAAWETAGQVYFARIAANGRTAPSPVSPPGEAGGRRHPSIAINGRGEILLAWSEGTGWQRGGSVAWQMFDASGAPSGPIGRATGLPVWGLSAVFARPDGGFTVVY